MAEVVGIAEIVGEAYPDPTADDPQWVVVDVAPVVPFTEPVSLATIKVSGPKAKADAMAEIEYNAVEHVGDEEAGDGGGRGGAAISSG